MCSGRQTDSGARRGGPSFEGYGIATVMLVAGRHYIHFSFFLNGPPAAAARLSWQPPGAVGLEMVPSSALFTQGIRLDITTARQIEAHLARPGYGEGLQIATYERIARILAGQ